jgi:hypothetical protein
MGAIVKDGKQRGVVTLDSIVRGYLMDLGVGLERYEQGLHWAIDCNRDFRMDVSREIKTVELPLTSWKAVEMPDDYITYVLIGIRKNGRLYIFSNDKEIPLFFDKNEEQVPLPNEELYNDEGEIDVIPDRLFRIQSLNGYGEDQGRLFGLGAKSNGVGYFRINHERREIQLNPLMDAGTVYLEYIADGYSPCSNTLVPITAAKLHRLYIHWQRLKFSKASNNGERAQAEKEYWDEFRRVNERMDDTTIADIVEAAIDGYSGSPHF